MRLTLHSRLPLRLKPPTRLPMKTIKREEVKKAINDNAEEKSAEKLLRISIVARKG